MVLSDDGLLLHIGPHKTGTTAIQGALWNAKAAMAGHGVDYPGNQRSHGLPARGVTGLDQTIPLGTMKHWRTLCEQVSASELKKTVISSEFFDRATDEQIDTILNGLGRDRIQVLVTLRPLISMLPSIWQQSLRVRQSKTYEEWLERIFDRENATTNSNIMWERHRHDELVERWASAIGHDRLSVLVVDESDHDQLMRQFESFIGLPDGMLTSVWSSANRSFTAPEAEAVRLLNVEWRARKWGKSNHARFVRFGSTDEMKRRIPPASEPRIQTPAWAETLVSDLSRRVVDSIASSGVEIIGDLESLVSNPAPSDAAYAGEPDQVPIEVATRMAIGAMYAGGAGVLKDKVYDKKGLTPYPGLKSAPARLLIAELRHRMAARIKGLFRRSST